MITIQDSASVEQTFNFKGHTPNGGFVYERQGDTLLGRAQIVLTLTTKDKVNRVKGKLSVPSVCTTDNDGCPIAAVSYIEVGSFDITVPTNSTELSRMDFQSMFSGLVGLDIVSSMAVHGNQPSA